MSDNLLFVVSLTLAVVVVVVVRKKLQREMTRMCVVSRLRAFYVSRRRRI